MRSKDLVARAIRGETVKVISQSSGNAVTVTGQIVEGRGPILYVDGKETSLRVIESEHGRSPLFDPRAEDLKDWHFDDA